MVNLLLLDSLCRIRDCLVVIPGEPLFRVFEQLRGVFLQGRQVVERVDPVEPAGMNETHEQVPDVGPVFGPEKEGVLAMKNGLFEGLLAEVIVQRGPRNPQKQGQWLPVLEHVGDGLAQGGVGLDPAFIPLFLQPFV